MLSKVRHDHSAPSAFAATAIAAEGTLLCETHVGAAHDPGP